MAIEIRRMACLGIVALALGCSKPPAVEEPDAYPFVQSTVRMADKDVEGAMVQLHSKDNKSLEIMGNYDSESNCYRFVTKEGTSKKAGVPEGDYIVTIKPGKLTKLKIPAKYADPAKSGLTAQVVEGKNFLLPFELTP